MAVTSLELAVLGLLKEGPMHGYELRKRLAVTLGPLYAVSYGSLYPCLKRLRKAGWVREGAPAPKPRRKRTNDNKAMTVGVTRRARKAYVITPDGERFFFDQLEQGAVYDTDGNRRIYLASDAAGPLAGSGFLIARDANGTIRTAAGADTDGTPFVRLHLA